MQYLLQAHPLVLSAKIFEMEFTFWCAPLGGFWIMCDDRVLFLGWESLATDISDAKTKL